MRKTTKINTLKTKKPSTQRPIHFQCDWKAVQYVVLRKMRDSCDWFDYYYLYWACYVKFSEIKTNIKLLTIDQIEQIEKLSLSSKRKYFRKITNISSERFLWNSFRFKSLLLCFFVQLRTVQSFMTIEHEWFEDISLVIYFHLTKIAV